LVDAPSGNIRGAGPGVAELEFDHTLASPRPAESFMLFAADKCGPGAYNLPLFLAPRAVGTAANFSRGAWC
jgi:fructose 1,6-bisphosphate aldolase/phosphatase